MASNPALLGISIAMFIGWIVAKIINANNKNKIGDIKCRRCGYQGRPKGGDSIFNMTNLYCPNCKSDDWIAISQL